MTKLEKVVAVLGAPYIIKEIDGNSSIYRDLGNGFEVEVFSANNYNTWLVNVWKRGPHNELMGVYEIPDAYLKDALGYYAVRYLGLVSQFRVEREDPPE